MSDSGARACIDADLTFGARVKASFSETVPLSAEQYWSAFDDYLALQRALPLHEHTELEPGPENGVGATIRFPYEGGITRETLVIKDDARHVWTIKIPEPNAWFSAYELSIAVHEDGEGAAVTMTIQAVMAPPEIEERRAILRALEQAGARIGQVSNFVLQRDGVRSSLVVEIRSPLQRFWDVVSDWGNVSWVQGATAVKLLSGGARIVRFGEAALSETLVECSAETHTLTYQVSDRSVLPVRLYRGTIHLEALSAGETRVTYSYVLLPKAGLTPEAARAQMDRSLATRLEWIRATFDVGAALPRASVVATVRAPIDQVWALFRPFGPEMMAWWRIYEWVALEPPGIDEVGAVRAFQVGSGTTYKERLVTRDDARHIVEYALVASDPPLPVRGIVTTVEMIAKGPDETEVRWSARLDAAPAIAGPLAHAQEEVYRTAIASLDRHLLSLRSLVASARGIPEQARLIWQQIARPEVPVYAYARYPRMAQLPDVPLEELPRRTLDLPPGEAFSSDKLTRMVQRIIEFASAETRFPARITCAMAQGTDPFLAYFGGKIERPEHIVRHWREDGELCRQLIQGVNPMVIRVCRSPREVPPSMAHLEAQGLSIEQLIAAKRLFILDYAELAGLKRYEDMVFYAPIVLVYREIPKEGGSRLAILGIQLTRHEGKNEVYTPGSSTPNKYLLAKLHVQCADNQSHQFISHLGLAHLAMEPLAIASHNAFHGTGHPIGEMLAPHFHDTIAVNFTARNTLVRPDPRQAFTDRTFAPGTAQGMEMVWRRWQKFDFFADSFPGDLAARGFDEAGSDGVEGFFYRDDGFKIWRALEAYAKDVVTTVYTDDAAVAADPVLQAWAHECSAPDRGAMPGFPRELGSRELLTRTLVNIVFRASAYHAAVNDPQLDYLSYVPNRAPALFLPVPEGEGDITPGYIQRALPDVALSHFKILFSYLLATPADTTLANMTGLAHVFPEIHARQKARLAEVSAAIRARNEALVKAGKPPYPYLDPERIAASVAI